jgi:hypothetical protein
MWQTSMGDRTLIGAEADLVRTIVGFVQDMINVGVEIDDPHVTEVPLFNALQPTQQLAMLHEVTRALLLENTPIPELTAIREATVHMLFRELVGLLECEIDLSRLEDEPDYGLRSMVLAVFQELHQSDNPEIANEWTDEELRTLPPVDCPEINEWNDLAESLADQILWDRDFEMEAILVDQSPEKAELMKSHLGITSDYFSLIAPDPGQEEFQKIQQELRELTGVEPSF